MKKEFQLTTEVYKLKEENNELNEKNNELKVENDQVKTRESRLKEEYNELKERESKSSEENQELKELKASNQQEIQRLWNELHQQATLFEQEKLKSGFSTQLISNLEQRLMDKTETINVYQTLVQAKNNEIKAMKIENENQELKRKLDEYERRSQSLIDNVNFTNDNNDNNNNTIQLDNQTSLNDTLNGSVDNIRVKIETESENDGSSSCQIGNKKRKVTSNDL
jgi:chromosome segregation ATPase